MQRENLGIIVQYKVKVKLCLGPLGGDVIAELPFTLMHPKPEPDPNLSDTKNQSINGSNSNNNNNSSSNNKLNSNNSASNNDLLESNEIVTNGDKVVEAIDHNLIQLEYVFLFISPQFYFWSITI